MGGNRRDFTVEFKRKVAAETLKGDRTLAETQSDTIGEIINKPRKAS